MSDPVTTLLREIARLNQRVDYWRKRAYRAEQRVALRELRGCEASRRKKVPA